MRTLSVEDQIRQLGFTGRSPQDVIKNPVMLLIRIKGLAKIGVAASDTNTCVDLSEMGHLELYEVIGRLAEDCLAEIWYELGVRKPAGQT